MESLSRVTIKAFLLEFRLSVRLKEKSNYTWHFVSQKNPPAQRGKQKKSTNRKNQQRRKNKTKQKQTNKQTKKNKPRKEKATTFYLGINL